MKRISVMLILSLAMFIFTSAFAIASPNIGGEVEFKLEEMTEFHLVDENSGFTIKLPQYMKTRYVKGKNEFGAFEVPVLQLKAPKMVENSEMLMFQVEATHPDAYRADVSVSFFESGQFSYVDTPFEDGQIPFYVYVGQYGMSQSLIENELLSITIDVYDKDSNLIISIEDLHLMYEGYKGFEVSDRASNSKPASTSASAAPTSSKVMVNGKEVSFQAYNIEGNNFFKLRDLAMALNGNEKSFEVGWNADKNAISLESNKAYTAVGGELVVAQASSAEQAVLSSSTIFLDGEAVDLTAYLIQGNNYFKLRDVAAVINFGVTWDGATSTIGIDSAASYVEE